ncbi:hypothetical protein pdam_00000426 [Pocillopora damicornis]|uniref:Uncharacterized protein n=1 Tax=Pocillopora damicornis TaxID=46731 RepID=A0A3M6UJ30_POCDA|nr:hypothetical protein pdam_00000426 [Pocillopora damicornis]
MQIYIAFAGCRDSYYKVSKQSDASESYSKTINQLKPCHLERVSAVFTPSSSSLPYTMFTPTLFEFDPTKSTLPPH